MATTTSLHFVPSDVPMARSQPLVAHCIHDGAEGVKKAWTLTTKYRNTSREVDIDKTKFDTKPADELWTAAQSYVRRIGGVNAKLEAINLSRLVIRYTDDQGDIQYIDAATLNETGISEEAQLFDLMAKVRRAAQRTWVEFSCTHNFNDGANRAKGAVKPLHIPIDAWKKRMPKTAETFISQGHFDHLVAVSQRDEKDVRRDMHKADVLLLELKKQIQQDKQESKSRLQTHFSAEEQKTLHQLAALEAEVEELDRFAIYWAVGVWGDANPATITKAERFQKAANIAHGVETTLRRDMKPDDTDLLTKVKDALDIDPLDTNALRGAGPFIHTYAGDVGDLIVPDKLDYIHRIDADKREERAPSLVEFITNALMHKGTGPRGKFLNNFHSNFNQLGFDLPPFIKGHISAAIARGLSTTSPTPAIPKRLTGLRKTVDTVGKAVRGIFKPKRNSYELI